MTKSEIIVELVEVRDKIGAYVPEAHNLNLTKEEKREILIEYNQNLKDRITDIIKELAKEESNTSVSYR